jgi:hypothetical protein
MDDFFMRKSKRRIQRTKLQNVGPKRRRSLDAVERAFGCLGEGDAIADLEVDHRVEGSAASRVRKLPGQGHFE